MHVLTSLQDSYSVISFSSWLYFSVDVVVDSSLGHKSIESENDRRYQVDPTNTSAAAKQSSGFGIFKGLSKLGQGKSQEQVNTHVIAIQHYYQP